MKYILAQPATVYFAWQIDVFLFSARSVGIELEDIHVLCSTDSGINDHFTVMMQKYPGVSFNFYADTRDHKDYIPSIKQNLLSQHLRVFTELQREVLFLVDSDICFTRPLKIDHLLDDNIWYVSDTIGYIGYDYILSKGRDVLDTMLNVSGMSESVVKSNIGGSGGAQYLFKNVTPEYLDDVIDMSHKLWTEITSLNNKKVQDDPDYHPIQIWTAEMWALLWVAWKKGQMTVVAPELDFCWATDHRDQWNVKPIYHGAGVTTETKGHFYKGLYTQTFPPLDLEIDPTRACYHYYNILRSALS